MSKIRFTPIANDDGMSLTCHAVNEVMDDEIETGQSAVRGEEVRLDCQYEANPENLTRLEWMRNGVVVEGERFHVEDTTLVIDNIQREDTGDYRYYICA